MPFHIHHHIEPSSEVLSRLDAINRKLDHMERLIMVDYTKLIADISAQTTVLQGVVVGVQGLNASNVTLAAQVADLQAAVAASGDPALQTAANAIDQTVQANTALVANLIPAVTSNTLITATAADAAATAAAAPAA